MTDEKPEPREDDQPPATAPKGHGHAESPSDDKSASDEAKRELERQLESGEENPG